MLRFSELFQTFPHIFESVFVPSVTEICPRSLVDMLKAECSSEEDETTYQHLKNYVASLDIQGTMLFHITVEPLVLHIFQEMNFILCWCQLNNF